MVAACADSKLGSYRGVTPLDADMAIGCGELSGSVLVTERLSRDERFPMCFGSNGQVSTKEVQFATIRWLRQSTVVANITSGTAIFKIIRVIIVLKLILHEPLSLHRLKLTTSWNMCSAISSSADVFASTCRYEWPTRSSRCT